MGKSVIFVDTSAWFSLIAEEDRHHEEVKSSIREIHGGRRGVQVTAACALDEAYTLIRKRFGLEPVKTINEIIR